MQKKSNSGKLIEVARKIRVDTITSLACAGSGHTGGSMGLADLFTVLYFNVMEHRPLEPEWSERDRLVLSIGHVAPVYYSSLANVGYFDREELKTLRKLGSRLQGHPGKEYNLPGIEMSSGSLGQGLSVAVGLAPSAKIDKARWKVFSVHGDGEIQEGSIWEAAMSAAHYKLDNLVAIIDRNRLQIDGSTEDVMALEPLAKKWDAFGWEVLECDGNNIENLVVAFEKAVAIKRKPIVIIAHTLMGKGVKSIENDHRWHGRAPTEEEAMEFIKEINGEI